MPTVGRNTPLVSMSINYRDVLADGLRYAVAIKPIDHVEKYDFDLKLRYVRAALPDAFADEVILMSEADFTRAQALNAQRYHEFTKKADTEADDQIVRTTYEQPAPTFLEDLIASSGLGRRGFRAAFRAIIEGKIKPLSHGKIGMRTLVSPEVPV